MTWLPIVIFVGLPALFLLLCLATFGLLCALQWIADETAKITGEDGPYSRKFVEKSTVSLHNRPVKSGPSGGCNASRPLAQNRPMEGLS